MKLVLVRHTEVIEEYQGRYNGHINIPLSTKGVADAKTLGEQLQRYSFDAIYCSDLLRCKQTLQQFQRKENVIYTELLREKSWGKHEGMSFEEIEKSGIQYSDFLGWIEALEGERIEDFIQRVTNFLNYISQQKQHDTILVCTHSGTIKTLYALKNKLSLEKAFSLDLPYGGIIEFDL